MKQPSNRNQNGSLSNETKITIVLILLAAGFLLLIVLLAFLLRGYILPQSAQAPAISTSSPISGIPSTSVVPTIFIPTPDCGTPTLVLGTTVFQIQSVTRASDGSLPVPTDTSGIAYWVTGTDTNPAFVLSPTPDNLSIVSALTVGSTATVTWSNCNSTTYSLNAPQQNSLSVSSQPDQSTEGITVFFQTDTSDAGFEFKGDLTEEQISVINTPVSGTSEVQAEIGLLDTTTSADGVTLKISVSIYNWGQSAFILSTNDVLLTQPDGTPLVMISSEPSLPKEVAPTATETVTFTFPRPASPTATLKIFTVEYDVDGY